VFGLSSYVVTVFRVLVVRPTSIFGMLLRFGCVVCTICLELTPKTFGFAKIWYPNTFRLFLRSTPSCCQCIGYLAHLSHSVLKIWPPRSLESEIWLPTIPRVVPIIGLESSESLAIWLPKPLDYHKGLAQMYSESLKNWPTKVFRVCLGLSPKVFRVG
jgi:hypothetical protein